jgi:hypothetical protein
VSLAPACSCGRKLAPLARMRHATIEVRRTCRGCGLRWRVLAKPTRAEATHTVHTVTLFPAYPTR